jgi:hypothetical protein
LVVVNKIAIVSGIHFPSPDNFGILDVRCIVDPFVVGIVAGGISDDHQLLSL